MITFGSLFSGIGGIDLGLERAGMVCKWQVEINDYANKVLEKHWPNVPRFRDVRECGSANLEYVDLICGGFPCQDISGAGKRAGINAERSGLWTQFSRILGELRPHYALVENVSNLLSGENGKWFGKVLEDLAAIGFDAEWHCIPAAAVGAPHIRDRVFILAYSQCAERWPKPKGRDNANRYITGREEKTDRTRLCRKDGRAQNVAGADSHDQNGGSGIVQMGRFRRAIKIAPDDNIGRTQWSIEPRMGRVAYGVSDRMDRLTGLGNAVVPQVAEFIGKQIVQYHKSVTEQGDRP